MTAGTETILQCLAYVGVPRTLNAFSTVRKMGISKTCVLDPVDTRYEAKVCAAGYYTRRSARHPG